MEEPADLAKGLFAATLSYILASMILFTVFSVSPGTIEERGFLAGMVSFWVSLGKLLGIVDLLAIIAYLLSIRFGGRGF